MSLAPDITALVAASMPIARSRATVLRLFLGEAVVLYKRQPVTRG